MPKFCQRCGAQNADWAQACQNCSIPLPGPQMGNPQGYHPNYPPQPQPGYGAYPQTYGYGVAPARYMPGDYAGIGKRFLASLLEGLVMLAGAIPGFVLMMIGASIADSANRRSEREMGEMMLGLGLLLMLVGYLGVYLYNIYLLG